MHITHICLYVYVYEGDNSSISIVAREGRDPETFIRATHRKYRPVTDCREEGERSHPVAHASPHTLLMSTVKTTNQSTLVVRPVSFLYLQCPQTHVCTYLYKSPQFHSCLTTHLNFIQLRHYIARAFLSNIYKTFFPI